MQQEGSDSRFGSTSKLCDLGPLSAPCLHFLIVKWALSWRLVSCAPQAFLLGPSALSLAGIASPHPSHLSSSVGSGLWLQTREAAWFGCSNPVPMPPRARPLLAAASNPDPHSSAGKGERSRRRNLKPYHPAFSLLRQGPEEKTVLKVTQRVLE